MIVIININNNHVFIISSEKYRHYTYILLSNTIVIINKVLSTCPSHRKVLKPIILVRQYYAFCSNGT